MIHQPIIDTDNPSQQIEVTHHNQDAPAGLWHKTEICLNHIKINVFIEGDFSVFVNDKSYRPIYGDICFLPPAQIHYGQIEKPTHLDYFELDIGTQALDHVSGGAQLLARLIKNSHNNRYFLRPKKEDENQVIKLCYLLENAVKQENKPLAFAYTVEILSLIDLIYANSKDIPYNALSKHTTAVIRYIEAHYNEKITIAQLSDMLGVSSTYLSLIFKKETGLGIHQYLTEYRIMKSTVLLKDHSVVDVCFLCGFCDSSHFISAFKKRFGYTPTSYKKRFSL